MQLHLQTWPEVEAYLQKSRGIILPIGSTEQHGPIGLIGTDAICAEIVARGVGETVAALVGPTIGVGMAQHHMAFAGSVTLRPSTLIAVLRDIVESLAVHGFERFYFVNAHGGNIATVGAAFSEIYAARSMAPGGNAAPIKCRLRNWWQGEGVGQLAKELYGNSEGGHATPSEVAMTQFAYPEAIDGCRARAYQRSGARGERSAREHHANRSSITSETAACPRSAGKSRSVRRHRRQARSGRVQPHDVVDCSMYYGRPTSIPAPFRCPRPGATRNRD